MPQYLFANNAKATVAAPITAASTQVTLTAGNGSLFPNPGPNQIFEGTFVKNGNTTIQEVVVCTSRTSDTCVIQRGAGALSWNAGDTFALLVNADAFNNAMVQPFQLQQQLGNFAVDIGSANAYQVILNPALTASVIGMPIHWQAMHTSTAQSTFSDGVNTATLSCYSGTAVPPGGIQTLGIYTTYWNGSGFVTSAYSVNLAPFAQSSQFTYGGTHPNRWELNAITGVLRQWGIAQGNAGGAVTSVDFPRAFSVVDSVVAVPYGVSGTTYVVDQSPGFFQFVNAAGGQCTWQAYGSA